MFKAARDFFFGSSARAGEERLEAKKRRGSAAPAALVCLPDDALIASYAYLGLVDGACAAVTCQRLAVAGRCHHPSVLVIHQDEWYTGDPAATAILDGRWRRCTPRPTREETHFNPGAAAVAVGEHLCCAPFPLESRLLHPEDELRNMDVYSLKTNSWRMIDHFAHLGARWNFTCCALPPDELVFIGGQFLGAEAEDDSPCSSVHVVNLRSDAWTRLPDLPLGVADATCCECRGKLYVLDTGLTTAFDSIINHRNLSLSEVAFLIYDPAQHAWTYGPPCPITDPRFRSHVTMLAAESRVFVFSQNIWLDSQVSAAAAFDTVTSTWSEIYHLDLTSCAIDFFAVHRGEPIGVDASRRTTLALGPSFPASLTAVPEPELAVAQLEIESLYQLKAEGTCAGGPGPFTFKPGLTDTVAAGNLQA